MHSVRFHEHQLHVVQKDAVRALPLDSSHQIPQIEKVVVNGSMKDMHFNKTMVPSLLVAVEALVGQYPTVTFAKKANIKLKVRKGMISGAKATLRGKAMYLFLDRLVTMGFPRMKHFEGLRPKSIGQDGNLSLTVDDPAIFSEIEMEFEKFRLFQSLNISIATNARNREEGEFLFRSLQFPFKG